MTDDTLGKGGADAGSASALIAAGSPDEETVLLGGLSVLPDDDADLDADDADDADLPDDLTETGGDGSARGGVAGTGVLSGGFGLAGLALAIVSLTTNWTSGVVISHGQYTEEMSAPSTGLSTQQQLDMYASAWHTQGWWALVFAAAAVLFGAGALLVPGIVRPGRTPGWAKAIATGAIIVGLVGALLAVLTIAGVFGGHLTAPASAS